MAFKNLRILLLINYNDGFIDGDEFVVLYGLYASKDLNFPCDSYIHTYIQVIHTYFIRFSKKKGFSKPITTYYVQVIRTHLLS